MSEIEPTKDVVNSTSDEVEAPAAPVVSDAGKAPAKDDKAKKAPAETRRPGVVVSGGNVDEVRLSACVYKNKFARKSLTVHHTQRRLAEHGYRDAGSDKDGWYGDLTLKAVADFQRDNKLEGDGLMNADTFLAIFEGDPHVTVVID